MTPGRNPFFSSPSFPRPSPNLPVQHLQACDTAVEQTRHSVKENRRHLYCWPDSYPVCPRCIPERELWSPTERTRYLRSSHGLPSALLRACRRLREPQTPERRSRPEIIQ